MFNREVIQQLRQVLVKTGIELKDGDATKEEWIKELEELQIKPAMAMKIKIQQESRESGDTAMIKCMDTGFEREKIKTVVKLQPQEKNEPIDDFLRRFGVWTQVCKIPEEKKLQHLWATVQPEVGRSMTNMDESNREDIKAVEEYLLAQFKVTPEAQLRRFRNEQRAQGESFLQFGQRLKRYLLGYMGIETREFEAMKRAVVPMILEQLLRGVNEGMKVQVMRRLNGERVQLEKILEVFDEELDIKTPRTDGQRIRNSEANKPYGEGDARCFRCGKKGHQARNCTLPDTKCFKCGRLGHRASECEQGNANRG